MKKIRRGKVYRTGGGNLSPVWVAATPSGLWFCYSWREAYDHAYMYTPIPAKVL